jgi:hypothetical protein
MLKFVVHPQTLDLPAERPMPRSELASHLTDPARAGLSGVAA